MKVDLGNGIELETYPCIGTNYREVAIDAVTGGKRTVVAAVGQCDDKPDEMYVYVFNPNSDEPTKIVTKIN